MDEKIAGDVGPSVDVYSERTGAACGYRFRMGTTYLVFPYRSNDGRLMATICSDTRPINQAQALLQQLRLHRDGKRFASLFGLFRRTQQPYPAVRNDNYDQPLPRLRIQLSSPKNTFETETDDNGMYAFYDLPAGEYTFAATLPHDLLLGQQILDDPTPPIQLPAGACFEHDHSALPTGLIRGRVIPLDVAPLYEPSVELFAVDRYSETEGGWWAIQGQKGYFEFDHVAPGEYVLVFNNRSNRSPDSGLTRTFYPGVF
jgi:hypothetical protein